jgi:hypothetical protein
VDLIEVIRIQSSGPTEAARALRKKLYVPCLCVCSVMADMLTESMGTCIVRYVR